MRATLKCMAGILLLVNAGSAAGRAPRLSWEVWQFVVGEWDAAGHGEPGMGAGRFSFAFDLQDRVLVRKSHTDYPATAGRPAFSHDDLMVVYADEAARKFRADYFDSEGHVIRYAVEFSPDGRAITFLSYPAPSQPRFRLTYTRLKDDSLGIKFEIAPPQDQGSFKVYVEGTARKR